MSYEVLARKWRPQQFDDVVGQQHVTETLRNAIKTSRIAHAYLFVGPRGIGKTSVARIFAKALNCVKGATITPCDKCDSCREIIAGTSMDVLEIDGASNNGVEQVREMRETVKYMPTHGLYKIYIIDEVHMLSVPAFNALLKTLEEPPPHVKFIFATTEPEKILATILSRCQRFDLRRIPTAQIVDRLKLIAKTEKIKVDDDALLAIARGSEGALRDAESALDQLVSFRGSKITESDVLSVFGLVSRGTLEDLTEKILKGDVKSVIEIVAELDEAGKDLQRLVFELMGHFRNLLICLHVDDEAGRLECTEAQLDVLKRQAKLTDTAHVLRLTEILYETVERMKYALSKRTLLETALIRCARASVVVSLEEILAQINRLRHGKLSDWEQDEADKDTKDVGGKWGKNWEFGIEGVTSEVGIQEGGNTEVREGRTGDFAQDVTVVAGSERRNGDERNGEVSEKELSLLLDKWHEIVQEAGRISVLARSSLIDTRPLSVEGDHVVIGLDPEFAGEIENLESGRTRKVLEHDIGRILKRKIMVDFVVQTQMEDTIRRVQDTVKVNGERRKGKVPQEDRKKKSKKDWTNDPTVQKALKTFGGTIMDVRE